MATWMNAEQIAARYVVGEQRLLEYGKRGNLAMRRCADGRVLFDGEGVGRFFRVRGAEAQGPASGVQAQNLGVLGVARLGSAPVVKQEPKGLGEREARARALRLRAGDAQAPRRLAKAG
ncbi:hypothetical protein [Sorangium sp. So ce388]|uniref:Uncharacterized protein n=1 Tax=Sorangium cellulosum TaxID=56 RepID=A0A150RUY4_SORCE|nr:hypothetical protein BE17_43030 [Sorangium cellulosum]